MLYDMHVHTRNSPDATLGESDLADRAKLARLSGIGFVAHVDFHPLDYCVGAFDPGAYDDSVALAVSACPGPPAILKGVEVGEPHRFADRIGRALSGRGYDFVTAGLHWVGDLQVLDPEPFEQEEPLALVEGYYSELLEMASSADVDVIAHMGIFRRGMARAGLDTTFDETSLWPGLLERLLSTMISRGIALEVNTSGLRRPERVTYPTAKVAGLYRALGGSLVTLGSDTHSEPWVFFGLEAGASMLRSQGFTEAFYIRDRRPAPYPL
jgi:histidinol-phosphatase (PHP family)